MTGLRAAQGGHEACRSGADDDYLSHPRTSATRATPVSHAPTIVVRYA